MERELLFTDKLQELRETAKAQGNLITEDQLQEAFSELSFDEEQLAMVREYLAKHKIGIGKPVDTEENLTGEEKNFLEMYLKKLKDLPAVSDGEKQALTMSAMAGDSLAQEKLCTAYLPQVVDVAKLYAGQGVYLEDLIGEGNVAVAMGVKMLGALEKPSEAEGMLGKMMMDAMEDYISEYAEESKKDKHITEKINRIADAAKKLAEEYGRKVTAEELAAETKFSQKIIEEAYRVSGDKIEDLEKTHE